MPYKSEKQRRFLHARHPEIAARWDAEYGGKKRKVSKARIPKPFTKKRVLALGAGGGTGLLAFREVPKLLKPPAGYEQEYVYKGLSRNQIAGMAQAMHRGGRARQGIEAFTRVGEPVPRAMLRVAAMGDVAEARVAARNMGRNLGQQVARYLPQKPRSPAVQEAVDLALIETKATAGALRDLSRNRQRHAELLRDKPPWKVGTDATKRRMVLMKDPGLAARRLDIQSDAKFRSDLAYMRSRPVRPVDAPERKRRSRRIAKGLNDLGLRNVLLHDRDNSRSAVSKAVATDSWADEQRYLENKQRADEKRRSGHKKTQVGTLMLGTTGLAGVSAPQWGKGQKHLHLGSHRKPAYTVLNMTRSPKGVHNVTTIPRLKITATRNPLIWAGTGAGLVGLGASQRASAGRQKHKLDRTIGNRIANERAVQAQQWANRGSQPK